MESIANRPRYSHISFDLLVGRLQAGVVPEGGKSSVVWESNPNPKDLYFVM